MTAELLTNQERRMFWHEGELDVNGLLAAQIAKCQEHEKQAIAELIERIKNCPYQQFSKEGLATDRDDLVVHRVYYVGSDFLQSLKQSLEG